MDWCKGATEKLKSDFSQLPEKLQGSETTGDPYEIFAGIVSLTAETFVMANEPDADRPGQVAQRLSVWHTLLRRACSEKFAGLTSPEGSALSREEANEHPDLKLLHAISRGVRANRNRMNEHARRTSPRVTVQHTSYRR